MLKQSFTMPKVHVNGTPCRLKINYQGTDEKENYKFFKKMGDENRINRE